VIKGRVGTSSAMGATLGGGGTGFRTWAPNARAVAVLAGAPLAPAATKAGFAPAPTDAMEALGDGSWGGFLPGIGEGDPYLFFIQGNGSAGWKRDPWARELSADPAYPNAFCLVRSPSSYPWHDQKWQTPAFSDLVIYQLHVGTWWAADRDGNDVRATRGGTFLDVVAKLDHLAGLGINAIQLLPIQEFETPFSLGYNGTDLFSPEIPYCSTPAEVAWRISGINTMLARYGKPPLTGPQLIPGINQLKCLVDLCHLRGIAVIFDQVYNHAFGHDDQSAFDDRSIWFYDRQAGTNRNSSLYFTDHVWVGPIFAYWNNWVSQYLIDNACFFINEYHADGLRYDEISAVFNNGGETFSQHVSETVRATRPASIQIAEYWNGDRQRAIQAPPSGLGFDAGLADGLRNSLRSLISQASNGLSVPLDLSGVATNLAAGSQGWQLDQCLENQDLTYAGHSDAARIPFLADKNDRRSWYARSRSRAATSLLLTAPGIISIFMGEDILEDKNWNDSPQFGGLIYWDGLTAKGESSMRDFLQCCTDLAHLRQAERALRIGSVRVSRAQNFDRVLVMHRWIEGEGSDIIVVVSFDELPKRDYSVGLPSSGRWREIFNSDVYDIFPNPAPVGNGGFVEASGAPLDGFTTSTTLTIPANGALVLKKA
jgi:1,4-alpha-glucan branching enzyme